MFGAILTQGRRRASGASLTPVASWFASDLSLGALAAWPDRISGLTLTVVAGTPTVINSGGSNGVTAINTTPITMSVSSPANLVNSTKSFTLCSRQYNSSFPGYSNLVRTAAGSSVGLTGTPVMISTRWQDNSPTIITTRQAICSSLLSTSASYSGDHCYFFRHNGTTRAASLRYDTTLLLSGTMSGTSQTDNFWGFKSEGATPQTGGVKVIEIYDKILTDDECNALYAIYTA